MGQTVGAIALLAIMAAGSAPIHAWRPWFALSVCALLGLFGQDLRRWSLARRGFTLAHMLAAPDEDAALARLLGARPDLVGPALR